MNVAQPIGDSVSVSLPVAVSLDRRTRLEKLQELLHLGAAEQRPNYNKTILFKAPLHCLIHLEGFRESELQARPHIYLFSVSTLNEGGPGPAGGCFTIPVINDSVLQT